VESQSIDPVTRWLQQQIAPAVEEASTLLYEYSRLEVRDVESSRELLWKLTLLNHRLGLLFADAIELKSEFQTQCDEVYSQVLLMVNSKQLGYKITVEMAKAAAELGTSSVEALANLYPSVVGSLGLVAGNEPKRKVNQLSSTVEKLRVLQRDMQESINGIKHLGNRDMQHAIHGV